MPGVGLAVGLAAGGTVLAGMRLMLPFHTPALHFSAYSVFILRALAMHAVECFGVIRAPDYHKKNAGHGETRALLDGEFNLSGVSL